MVFLKYYHNSSFNKNIKIGDIMERNASLTIQQSQTTANTQRKPAELLLETYSPNGKHQRKGGQQQQSPSGQNLKQSERAKIHFRVQKLLALQQQQQIIQSKQEKKTQQFQTDGLMIQEQLGSLTVTQHPVNMQRSMHGSTDDDIQGYEETQISNNNINSQYVIPSDSLRPNDHGVTSMNSQTKQLSQSRVLAHQTLSPQNQLSSLLNQINQGAGLDSNSQYHLPFLNQGSAIQSQQLPPNISQLPGSRAAIMKNHELSDYLENGALAPHAQKNSQQDAAVLRIASQVQGQQRSFFMAAPVTGQTPGHNQQSSAQHQRYHSEVRLGTGGSPDYPEQKQKAAAKKKSVLPSVQQSGSSQGAEGIWESTQRNSLARNRRIEGHYGNNYSQSAQRQSVAGFLANNHHGFDRKNMLKPNTFANDASTSSVNPSLKGQVARSRSVLATQQKSEITEETNGIILGQAATRNVNAVKLSSLRSNLELKQIKATSKRNVNSRFATENNQEGVSPTYLNDPKRKLKSPNRRGSMALGREMKIDGSKIALHDGLANLNNKMSLDQHGSLGSIVYNLTQDAEENTYRAQHWTQQPSALAKLQAPVNKLERIKVVIPALVDTPLVKNYMNVTSTKNLSQTKQQANTKVQFLPQNRAPVAVVPKYERLARFAKTTTTHGGFFAEIKDWNDNRKTTDDKTIKSIIQDQKDSYKPQQRSSIKQRSKNYSSEHSIDGNYLIEQFREAKRVATVKNNAQFRIDDLKNRFEKSSLSAVAESLKHVNQLEDVEEIEMNSSSGASDNQAQDQEVGMENAIIGRLLKTRKSLEKFDPNGKISKQARQNTMAIEFHKIQKNGEKEERKKFNNIISEAQKSLGDVMQMESIGLSMSNNLPVPKKLVELMYGKHHQTEEFREEKNVQLFEPENQEIVMHPGFGDTVINAQVQFLIDTWKEKNSIKRIDKENVIELKQIKQHEETIKKLKFTEIGRNMNKESFLKNFQQEPMLIYHRIIKESGEICLPLISKVIDGKLVLQGYTLDSGHFEALATSIKETQQPVITDIYLDNCGVDDHELALLLDGLTQMKKFEKFVYINNVFSYESLDAIKPLLKRRSPFNLQELRLVNLQTSPEIIEWLLDFMIEENVELRTLGLVQLHIGQIGITKVARFVQESEYLEDLDLSWNDLIPLHFAPLLEIISKNRTLKSLNLSWNIMIDKADGNNPVSFEAKSAADEYAQKRKEAIASGVEQIVSEKDAAKNHPQLVIYCFNQFIRYNQKLQSINLSSCGLNAQVLVGLVPAIRHAKSLLCLHLTSNPGISDQVEKYYSERLNVAPKYPDLVCDIDYEDIEEFTKKKLAEMSEKQVEVFMHKLKFVKSWKTEEVFKYLNNKRLKPLTKKQNVSIRSEGRDLTINRILGHVVDLPGMGRWQLEVRNELDSCWRCDSWMYTLIFWNPTIGDFNQINNQSIEKNCKKDLVQKIRNANKDNHLDEELPLFFSNVSDWRPKPFFPLIDFANQYEKQKIDWAEIDTIAIELAREKFKFQDFSLLGKEKLFTVKAYMRQKTEEMGIVKKKEMIKRATEILFRHLRYQKPKFLGLEHVLRGDFEDVWVLPIFLPSGKNEWMIRSHANQEISDHIHRHGRNNVKLLDYQIPEDAEFKYYYNRSIIEIREERVPKFTKESKAKDRVNEFDFKNSVWKDWKDDNDKAFQHDVGYWKLNRITSDKEERIKVRKIIWDNFQALKEIFLQVVAHYRNPPDIQKREFNIFCAQAGILDKKLNTGIVDTYFKATNFEEQDMDQNDDNALCRFEFMEILIRLAKGKYVDTGKTQSLSKALQMILDNHVLQMTGLLLPWSQFRNLEMYNNEVNNLMQINLISLRNLYERLRKFKQFKKERNLVEFFVTPDHPSIDQMVTWLTDTIPGVDKIEIIQAWSLSKMSCSYETDHAEYEYTFMRWPEFIEFVPRLAYFKYYEDLTTVASLKTGVSGPIVSQNNMKLVDKLKSVLDDLLPLIGEERKEPPEMVLVSDSDDDY